jgi:hypothetical protein
MSIQLFIRRVAVLFLVALAAGCSSTKSGTASKGSSASRSSSSAAVGNDCRWNRSKCLYEGSYEPGEREYAEQEAKDLNQAEYERLRRAFGK